MNGRPGPVVLALPEDMLRETADVAAGPRIEAVESAPTPAQVARLAEMLNRAERPMLVLGGGRWTPRARELAHGFAERFDLPVGASFRRQHLFDPEHPNYAGDIGLGANPALVKRLEETDLFILLGARFSENPSQGFTVLGIPKPAQPMVHVHPGPEEIGRIYAPDLGICAAPEAFLDAVAGLEPRRPASGRAAEAHAAYRAWTDRPERADAAAFEGVETGAVIRHLREALPEDAILTNGAGNYAVWLHRFYRYRRFGTHVAPTSGSMGYGLPAAIAAKLRHPEREVVCLAGDGCFQMTGMEFGAAVQFGAAVVVLVIDNGSYGTIRMHQERDYPGRVSATALVNPDFAALARAYGAHGETVTETAAFPDAFARARAATGPALLHVKTDVEAITPAATLSALRAGRKG